MASRTKNTRPSIPATAAEPAEPVTEPDDGESLAEVIPLGLFDPLEDPWRRQ